MISVSLTSEKEVDWKFKVDAALNFGLSALRTRPEELCAYSNDVDDIFSMKFKLLTKIIKYRLRIWKERLIVFSFNTKADFFNHSEQLRYAIQIKFSLH